MTSRKSRPKTPPPESFSPKDRESIRKYCRQKYPQLMHRGPGGLSDLMEDMKLYKQQNEVEHRDWVNAAKRWIKQQARIEFNYAQRRGHEVPQMPRAAPKPKPDRKPNTLREIQLKLIDGGKK